MTKDVENYTPYYDNQTLDEKKSKKCDTITEIAPDGKQTIVEGKEPLKKDPKKKTTIKERWSLIKASMSQAFRPLDNSTAIAHADDILGADDDQSADQGEQQPQQTPDASPQGAEQPQVQDEQADQQPQGDDSQGIHDSLKEHGYSDEEINFIMSGHAPPIDDPQVKRDDREHELELQHKQEAHKSKIGSDQHKREMDAAKLSAEQMRQDELHEHEKKMKELEHSHRIKMSDAELELHGYDKKAKEHELELTRKEKEIEIEHKKRMLELEYEKAKKEADAELELKLFQVKHEQKEAALDAEQKRKHKDEQHKLKMQWAKEEGPPEKEDKKPAAKGKK